MPRTKEAFEEMRATTRQKIKEATLSLVARKGVSIKIEEIAISAGVSKGLLYNHYTSKEVLITELAQEVAMSSRKNINQILTSDTFASEKIKRITNLVYDMLLSKDNNGANYFMFMTQVGMSGFSMEKLNSLSLPHSIEIIAQIVEVGQSEGSVVEGDPLQLAITYWSAIQGLGCHMVMGIPLKIEPGMLLRILLKNDNEVFTCASKTNI